MWVEVCRFCRDARWLIMNICALVIISWGIIGWYQLYEWYHEELPVVTFGQGSISDPIVSPFQSVVFKQPVKKLRNCPGHIQRIITGQCGHHILYAGESTLSKGFDGQLIYPVSIPDKILPGECQFYVRVSYECSFFDKILHRQIFESPPIYFKVIKGKDDLP